MSNLQVQHQILQQLYDMRQKALHLARVIQATNPSMSERTLHDQVTINAKDIAAMAENLEWLLHENECCE